jgi:hypothetical protein
VDRDAKAAMETVKRTVHTLLSNSYDLGKLIVTKVRLVNHSIIQSFLCYLVNLIRRCGVAWRAVSTRLAR